MITQNEIVAISGILVGCIGILILEFLSLQEKNKKIISFMIMFIVLLICFI